MSNTLLGLRGLAIGALATLPAAGESLFQIGNSLTEDSAPNGLVELAASAGIELTSGLHIRLNTSLEQIWDAPDDYTRVRSRFGPFDQALPANAWDHVVLQVFRDGESTFGGDIETFNRYRDLTRQLPANSDTQFYVYAPWPWSTRWAPWDTEIETGDTTLATHRRPYFNDFVDQLNEGDPDRWRLIPAGEVFYELRERIADPDEDGPLAGVRSIYRDAIHANGIGRFAAATTVFATVFQTNPVGLPVPYSANPLWDPFSLPPDLALEIQQLVWDVVVRTRRSGVSPLGDFDISTVIDEQDYDLWSGAFAAQSILSADANGDGVVDQADGELWVAGAQPGEADYDGDRRITNGDREVWQAAYATHGGTLDADVNGDGIVNAVDYTTWRDEYDLRQATDFNADGIVDAEDAEVWQAELGWSVDLPTDANGDGIVNAVDYTIWRDNRAIYNTPLSVSVPEPNAVLLTATTGGLALLIFRRVV